MGKISMPQGKGSQMHNLRDYEKYGMTMPDNIDPARTNENLVLRHIDVREAYDQIFGEAVKEYNSRQKRKDRQISSYLEQIKKSKNGEKPFYEDVLQWGSKDDFEKQPELRYTARNCLKEYVDHFEERNPNLRLIGAYIHMDEASPHLHLDYIPVASGYKRGLKQRNSLDRAMKEMGYAPEGEETKQNNATKVWKNHERAYFGEICREHGLLVEKEEASHRRRLSVPEYKKEVRELEQVKEEHAAVKASTIAEKRHLHEIEQDIEKTKEAAKNTLISPQRAIYEEIKPKIEKAEQISEYSLVKEMRSIQPSGLSRKTVKVPVSLWSKIKDFIENTIQKENYLSLIFSYSNHPAEVKLKDLTEKINSLKKTISDLTQKLHFAEMQRDSNAEALEEAQDTIDEQQKTIDDLKMQLDPDYSPELEEEDERDYF